MPRLETEFSDSGIKTTTPTVGQYGGGGLGIDPLLSRLMRTRLSTAQVLAERAQNEALNPKRVNMTPRPGDTRVGRTEDQQRSDRLADAQLEQQRLATESARQQMLQRQSQARAAELSDLNRSRGVTRYGLTGNIIQAPLGGDERFWLQDQGYSGGR